MPCPQCGTESMDGAAGLCEPHFEAQREAIRAKLNEAGPIPIAKVSTGKTADLGIHAKKGMPRLTAALASVLGILFIVYLFAGDLGRPAPVQSAAAPEDDPRTQSRAWLSCQGLARSRFKAPTQTEFELYPIAFAAAPNSEWYSVQGVAHSPNSFGVKLRHLVACDMKMVGDPEESSGWRPISASVFAM